MIAVIIETGKLLEVVLDALLATVGVAVLYSLLVLALARATEQRKHRSGAALAYGALAVACALGCLAVVAYGVTLTASK